MALSPAQRVDADGKSYGGFRQDHEYTHISGLVVMPVLGPVSKHRILRLHSGYGTRRVTFDAIRTGAPPSIPAAVDTPGDTLIQAVVTPSLPRPNEQAVGFDWQVQGEYLYVQNTPRVAGVNAFPTGNHAFATFPQSTLASDQIGNYVTSAIFANPGGDPTDAISEYAFARAQVSGTGTVTWPYTFIPAAASSTHLIA